MADTRDPIEQLGPKCRVTLTPQRLKQIEGELSHTMPRPHVPPPPPSTSSSLCPLVPGVPKPLSFQQTLPIKFKTEAFGERVWHFLSRPPICLYSPPHLPGEQISLAVRKGASGGCFTSVPVCLPPPQSTSRRQGLLWTRPWARRWARQCSEALARVGFAVALTTPSPCAGPSCLQSPQPAGSVCILRRAGPHAPLGSLRWCGERKLGMMAALPSGRTWGSRGGFWKRQVLEFQVLKTLLPSITRGRGRRQLLRALAPLTGDPHFQRDLSDAQPQGKLWNWRGARERP